ncbi:MAG: GNAT family N-acetyltransferase [Deltaproteobacteria bacterium]|nr:GNAT family N-acetyltransferase [Deltaproteobacteria bacterium]MCW5803068.1 GNAT family N-acetyltransferase [Deltaproteobacteria bacterium]
MALELLDPLAHGSRVAETWTRLAARSYFTSWGWIENWLACLPRGVAPRLAVWDDGATACFLTRRLDVRRRVIASRAYYLNVSGVPRLDELLVEYNGVVGREPSLAELVDGLPGGWDEIMLPGLRADAFGGVHEGDRGRYRVLVERRVPCYQVPLAKVRAHDYPSLLSSQTRSQLRRAQRLARVKDVEVAATVPEALAIYAELVELHGASWRAKGQPGAFADPWFDRFHRRLIAERFAAGEIQLVRVRGADRTIGCLYNFVHAGRVLQYQTGFAMYDDNAQKPGYVAHAAAIAHSAASGLDVYDFLAGEMRYKKSLSTDADALVWVRVQRPRLRFAIEDRALAFVRSRRGKPAADPPPDPAAAQGSPAGAP